LEINSKEFNLELNRFDRKVQYNRGFTLVELLIVVAIVSLIATMALLGFQDFMEKTKISRAAEEIRGLEKEIIAYSTDKATYPAGLVDIGRETLKDPWGNSYFYSQTPGTRHNGAFSLNTDFDLYSTGPDGLWADLISDPLSVDDIIRADDGSFCAISIKHGLL
jgi:general secretion pathway protein G